MCVSAFETRRKDSVRAHPLWYSPPHAHTLIHVRVTVVEGVHWKKRSTKRMLKCVETPVALKQDRVCTPYNGNINTIRIEHTHPPLLRYQLHHLVQTVNSLPHCLQERRGCDRGAGSTDFSRRRQTAAGWRGDRTWSPGANRRMGACKQAKILHTRMVGVCAHLYTMCVG